MFKIFQRRNVYIIVFGTKKNSDVVKILRQTPKACRRYAVPKVCYCGVSPTRRNGGIYGFPHCPLHSVGLLRLRAVGTFAGLNICPSFKLQAPTV